MPPRSPALLTRLRTVSDDLGPSTGSGKSPTRTSAASTAPRTRTTVPHYPGRHQRPLRCRQRRIQRRLRGYCGAARRSGPCKSQELAGWRGVSRGSRSSRTTSVSRSPSGRNVARARTDLSKHIMRTSTTGPSVAAVVPLPPMTNRFEFAVGSGKKQHQRKASIELVPGPPKRASAMPEKVASHH
ncbi:hypothetical protein B0H11DRAFT_189922 [Mycena galericulata]|nr:hypothetical protein B0H11DRAFT_189922 [Mycena galericulata]